MLLEALRARVAQLSAQEFYYLARACLVKDERHFDRFDRVFAEVFAGAEKLFAQLMAQVPAEWLQALADARLLGGGEAAHRGARWLGQAAGDLAPAPARAGRAPRGRQQVDRHRRARRPSARTATTPKACASGRVTAATAARSRCGTSASSATSTMRSSSARATSSSRCASCASSRARARPSSWTLTGTIDATARNAGLLDLKLVPERHNAVKVLLFLDVGGSMDDHVRVCEELFSAARGGVQAPRALLLPQLPLREPVEGQPAGASPR